MDLKINENGHEFVNGNNCDDSCNVLLSMATPRLTIIPIPTPISIPRITHPTIEFDKTGASLPGNNTI